MGKLPYDWHGTEKRIFPHLRPRVLEVPAQMGMKSALNSCGMHDIFNVAQKTMSET
jgi:hypothetical protein